MIINIGFCDMPKNFNINDNLFTRIICKYFDGFKITENPDFLIYSVFGANHYKYNNCVKIFFTGEPVIPNFNECDYGIGYDYMSFGERYLRRPVWMMEERFYNNYLQIDDEAALNRKFCNFVYANDSMGEGASLRKQFALKLAEYKPIDCPGKVLNNMKANLVGRDDGDWKKGKIDFIKDYKFTISFENTSVSGYTTEKMLHPIVARTVPIYWGNPDVSLDFNGNAFISCNGYEDDFDKVIEKIIELDNDNQKYLDMLHASPMSDSFNCNEEEDFERRFVDILKKGNVPFNKDSIGFTNRMSINSLSRKEKIKFFLLK